ncbi:uncharacterized protein LOC108911759 isoform X1 [Anoplophora glabripennis]|uniref:uncharacterized protein LOC108911759 isoform X1 n=1 Tax=Anoplophora glabripennis TaxID=217634 RepID=UPI0008751137|nr:uncharacterized protein LOC108911759 isoform X1 [Anoplophora glabripennis]
MSENIEIRTIIGNRNISTVSDTPVTDPASGDKKAVIIIWQLLVSEGLEGSNAFVCQRSKLRTGFSIKEDLTKSNIVLMKKAIDKYGFSNVWSQTGKYLLFPIMRKF